MKKFWLWEKLQHTIKLNGLSLSFIVSFEVLLFLYSAGHNMLNINAREYRRCNQKLSIQRNCQHKTKKNKIKTQHNTSRYVSDCTVSVSLRRVIRLSVIYHAMSLTVLYSCAVQIKQSNVITFMATLHLTGSSSLSSVLICPDPSSQCWKNVGENMKQP